MKKEETFSKDFISEIESLQVLGGTANPLGAHIADKCSKTTNNCFGGNCTINCGANCFGCTGTNKTTSCK